MNDNMIIDTNVLVYAFDLSEPEKRSKCKPIIESIFRGETKGIITNQILAEFFVTLTKKIQKPLNIEQAKMIICAIIDSDNWIKMNYSEKTLPKAIGLTEKTNIPFWDALIAATMIENDVFIICSEDQDFKKIREIKISTPF
jgi:predicted nucleic acid-binding protein